MKDWFSRYNQREQLSLLLLAVAVACYLLFFVVWSPITSMREEMVARNESASEVLQRVDAMVSEVIRLRSSGEGTTRKRNLTSLINQSTSRLDLPVSRLQPNSRGEIQVRLENAAFEDIIRWLYDMEYNEGLMVREVSITQSGVVGRVNASVRIAQGA